MPSRTEERWAPACAQKAVLQTHRALEDRGRIAVMLDFLASVGMRDHQFEIGAVSVSSDFVQPERSSFLAVLAVGRCADPCRHGAQRRGHVVVAEDPRRARHQPHHRIIRLEREPAAAPRTQLDDGSAGRRDLAVRVIAHRRERQITTPAAGPQCLSVKVFYAVCGTVSVRNRTCKLRRRVPKRA